MSFSEIEIKIAKLLMEIAEGERSIEITRRVLSDCIEFNPYQIFNKLDVEKKNRISPNNIINFALQKGISISQEEAKLIFLFYDKDQDGLLSYDELIDLIQSRNSKFKKLNNCRINENGISYNIEFSLEKLLEKELKLAKDIIFYLKSLQCKQSFDIHNIFHLIKGQNNINIDNLKCFLDKNNISFLESDLNFIINRLDINKDGKIDFNEFHSLFGFPNCFYCCPCITCPFCGTKCCNECLFGTNGCIHHNLNSPCNCLKNNINFKNSSMKKIKEEKISNSLSLRLSPERKYGPIEIEICDKCHNIPCSCKSNYYENNSYKNLSPLRKNINEEKLSDSLSLRTSPNRKYGPIEVRLNICNNCNNYPCSCKNQTLNNLSILNNSNNNNINDDFNQFNNFLKILMKGEKEIELCKIELSLKNDFNCEDIFRLFEFNGRGFISFEDLKYGLELLDIKTNEYIINLLINRFDLSKKGKINYADFFDMIVPFQRSYRNLVEERIPISNNPESILRILNKNTISSLKILFICIIEFEYRLNDIRKRLRNLRLMNLFNLIDINNLGYFDYSNLINYFKKNRIDFKQLDADLLFIRFDKNRNGKIEFKEIEEEFFPI